MREEFEQVHEKLDKISEDVVKINNTLIKQESNLELHMYRTDLAEKRITYMERTLVAVGLAIILGLAKIVGFIG
jgi:type II restriction/modification system DNA methylase subunit YeeA